MLYDLTQETDALPANGHVSDLAVRDERLPGELTETGYSLPDGLSFHAWAWAGEVLRRMDRSVRWWIGDWINYGERQYGERYSQAIEVTGRQVQDLMNMAWVSSLI